MVDPSVPGNVKALEEDVIKRPPPEFTKSWLEWVAESKAEQIMRSGTIGSTQLTLFTVPKNFTLFITSVWGTVRSNAVGDGIRLAVSGTADDRADFFRLFLGGVNTTEAISRDFTMPIDLPENSKIDLAGTGTAGVSATGGFTGFILPKLISRA